MLALQPFFEGLEMTSVLVMGSRTSVTWSERDRGIFRAVGRSLELALDRAAKTRRLEEERTALEAFTRFTEAVGTQSDVQMLVQQAITLLHETCAVDVAHFQREGELFKVTAWSTSADPTLLPQLQHGFILRDSSIARVLRENKAAFIDHWNDTELLIAESGIYQAVAGHPYFVDHQLERVLMIGSRTSPMWTEREKRIFSAVGRSLELALDRAAQTQRLDEERAALEAFTHFTEQVGSETEVAVLVHQAITLLVDTCGADVTYLEREGDLFKATAWNAQFDPALLTRLHAGFPLKQSNLALILREQSAAFIDHWDATAQWIEESRHLQAVAGYPVFQEGDLQSVLIMGSRRLAIWTERQKGIFRAVGRSLDLALQRATQTQLLRAQRDALAARTQELSIATEELEVFSYSVSHDLRTPVRHMLGFLQLARNALDGKLDARSARYLDVVGQAGQQMNALIDALLDVSRTARQPLNLTTVDLKRVLQHIQDTLTPDLLTRNIQWHVAALPVVQGDQTALTQVLTQFIENALKFSRTRDPAVIRVYAADQGDTWGIFVQDNGVGFDPRYRERLFNLFQRLHTAQEVTGTGVGLASVRRLILKHGGQVFAEGHLEQGATFGFSLPKVSPLNTRTP
ncbi:ATP-binding protein (plasmid) [Deinococcus sp. KNUC1210]|uniref:sensor histidine kinase n=1 Tax=Deinococcus sp. KNUC1210 TaxID=2917691 RepID=UPI001EF03C40|nr:ATP-binding protein [Deinococcus sp. KNUC1210]ULH18334.1 ATP-binding protein [Deinococcus sp. KNUC1210]